jgi:hypothetical protein
MGKRQPTPQQMDEERFTYKEGDLEIVNPPDATAGKKPLPYQRPSPESKRAHVRQYEIRALFAWHTAATRKGFATYSRRKDCPRSLI